MNNLEQILETGTDAKRELVRLTTEFPSKPKEVLQQVLTQKIIASSVFLAGTSGLAYGLQNAGTVIQVVGGLGVVLGGLGTVAHSYDLVQACRAGYYFMQPKKWEKVMPSSQERLFYLCEGKLTNTPTPVEVVLGTRVYPKQNFDDVKNIPIQTYGFLTDVIVREVDLNFFTEEESDYVPGIGTGYKTVRKVKMKINFEKENTFFEFNAKYEVGCEPSIYTKLTTFRTDSISMLFEAGKKELEIKEIFQFTRSLNLSNENIKFTTGSYD